MAIRHVLTLGMLTGAGPSYIIPMGFGSAALAPGGAGGNSAVLFLLLDRTKPHGVISPQER